MVRPSLVSFSNTVGFMTLLLLPKMPVFDKLDFFFLAFFAHYNVIVIIDEVLFKKVVLFDFRHRRMFP